MLSWILFQVSVQPTNNQLNWSERRVGQNEEKVKQQKRQKPQRFIIKHWDLILLSFWQCESGLLSKYESFEWHINIIYDFFFVITNTNCKNIYKSWSGTIYAENLAQRRQFSLTAHIFVLFFSFLRLTV